MPTLLPTGVYTSHFPPMTQGVRRNLTLQPRNERASGNTPTGEATCQISDTIASQPSFFSRRNLSGESRQNLFALWGKAEIALTRLAKMLRKVWRHIAGHFRNLYSQWSALTKQDIVRNMGKVYTGYVSQPMYELVERQALFSPVGPTSLRSLSANVRKAIGHTRFFPVQALGGIELAAWYMPAKPNKPTILFHHGRQCNLASLKNLLHSLHQDGFGIFAYDYPGFGKSEGKPSIKTIHLAASAAREELARLGIPPHQQIQMGHSLGGAVVTDLIHRSIRNKKPNELPRALVLVNTLSSPRDVLQSQADEYRSFNWIFKRSPDLLKRFPEILDFFNLKQKLSGMAEYKVPTLILHADQDAVFPEKIGQTLARAAENPKAKPAANAPSPVYYRKLKGGHYLDANLSTQVGRVLSDFSQVI